MVCCYTSVLDDLYTLCSMTPGSVVTTKVLSSENGTLSLSYKGLKGHIDMLPKREFSHIDYRYILIYAYDRFIIV